MEVSLNFVNILEINYILIRDVYVREASNMFTYQKGEKRGSANAKLHTVF